MKQISSLWIGFPLKGNRNHRWFMIWGGLVKCSQFNWMELVSKIIKRNWITQKDKAGECGESLKEKIYRHLNIQISWGIALISLSFIILHILIFSSKLEEKLVFLSFIRANKRTHAIWKNKWFRKSRKI